MRKSRLNRSLNILMGSAVGVFAGYGLYAFWDHRAHPGLYEMQSAPWYTGTLIYGIFAAVVVLLCLAVKWIIRKTGKR